MRLYRRPLASLRWVGLCGAAALLSTAGAACGSGTGTISAISEDAAPNQRGSLDGGADTGAAPDLGDTAPDGSADDAADDGSGADADARDSALADATAEVAPPECAAGSRRCDGRTPQTCDQGGAWRPISPACPFACSAGDCTGVCVPGAFQCAEGNRQLCGATGEWMDYQACPFVCLAGDCAGTCAPGRTRCVGGQQQTCSASGDWQTTGVLMRELLTNAGFDAGETGWTNSGVPVVYAADGSGNANAKSTGADNNGRPEVTAQSGDSVAWLGGLNREDDVLTQDITVPSDASSVTLSFYYVVVSNEDRNASDESDVLDISLLDSAGEEMPLGHLSDNNTVDAWTQFSMAIPTSLAGQTVTLQFHAVTSATQVTSFYLDTVSVQAVACP